MSTEIVSRETSEEFGFSAEQVNLIKTNIAKGATDDELKVFLLTCQRVGLDPWSRQIYLIPRWDSKLKKEIRTPQFAIDGFRSIASRTKEHGGTDDAVYDSEEGEYPKKASVTVYRLVNGERQPFTATARWSEYAQRNREGQLTSFWASKPYLMLGKCAEALALRKAFPQELSGLYTVDEMEQASNPSTVTVETLDPNASKKADAQAVFYLKMLLESSKADVDEVNAWLKRNFNVESIDELSQAQVLKMTELMEEKYKDRIEKVQNPPETPPDAGGKPSDTPEPTPTPEPAPEVKIEAPVAKRDWLKEARLVKTFDEGDKLLADMKASGESKFKITTVQAAISQALPV